MNRYWKIDPKCFTCKYFHHAPGLDIWCGQEEQGVLYIPKKSCDKYEKITKE